MKFFSLWTLSLLALLWACTPDTAREDPDTLPGTDQAADLLSYGKLEGQTYVNGYFGLELPLPAAWYTQERAANAELEQVQGNVLDFSPADSLGMVPMERLQVVYLLVAFQNEPGSQGESGFNPSFNLIANQLKGDSIESPTAYLEQVREELMASGMFTEGAGISERNLSGHTFQTMDMAFSFEGMDIKQRYLVTMVKGYALQITLSYTTDEEEAALAAVVDQLKLD